MCNGFGGFYSKDGRVYFTTPDGDGDCSHSNTAHRLLKGIDEKELVPFEIPDWSAMKFHWDTINKPDWADGKAQKICIAKLKEVKLFWAEYKKVTAPASAEYKKVKTSARAEYEKVTAPALAEYEKVTAPALAEYEKVRDTAWAEYEKVGDTAWAEYEKVTAPALAEYEKVRDTAVGGIYRSTKAD